MFTLLFSRENNCSHERTGLFSGTQEDTMSILDRYFDLNAASPESHRDPDLPWSRTNRYTPYETDLWVTDQKRIL